MVKVVFMGTPDFSVPCLQVLIETQNVAGVVTQPDRPAGRGRHLRMSPVKQLAIDAGVPVYQPKTLRSEEAAGLLHEWDPEIIVVAAFGQILQPHVLELPAHGCLNVHASLLPRWRGASPIQHAIMAGDKKTGITLMKMDAGLDTGPIFVSKALPITDDDTAATLHDRLAELGARLLSRSLEGILSGDLAAEPQDERLATYAPMIKKEDGQLDWQKSGIELDRQIRAMTPWPGAFTSWQGRHLKILQAAPGRLKPLSGKPGQIVTVKDAVFVITGDGALKLDTIQLAGKKAINAEDFLRGHPDFSGSCLGK